MNQSLLYIDSVKDKPEEKIDDSLKNAIQTILVETIDVLKENLFASRSAIHWEGYHNFTILYAYQNQPKFKNLLNDCVEKIREQMFKQEIDNYTQEETRGILTKTAIRLHESKSDKAIDDPVYEVVSELRTLVKDELLCIIPTTSFKLMNDLDSFNMCSDIICTELARVEKEIPRYKTWLDKFEDSLDSNLNQKKIYNKLNINTFFHITIKSSRKKAAEKVHWLIDAITSLFRLYYYYDGSKLNIGPSLGESENMFYHRSSDPRSISTMYNSKGTKCFEFSGIHDLFTPYHIYPDNFKSFDNDRFSKICDKIVRAEEGSIYMRIQKALSWMTKARTSKDLAMRFIFFFTASETLIILKRESNITEKIARRAAIILSKKSDTIYKIYTDIKKLYRIRCSTIHSGGYQVKRKDHLQLQKLTEELCFNVIEFAISSDQEKSDILMKQYEKKLEANDDWSEQKCREMKPQIWSNRELVIYNTMELSEFIS